MYHLMEALRIVAVLINPVMPGASRKILSLVGAPEVVSLTDALPFGRLAPGVTVSPAAALFPRVERLGSEEGKAPGGDQKQQPQKPSGRAENLVDMTEFGRGEIRGGRITDASRVEKSDKLLLLKVDVGRPVQIVAGIGRAYDPNDLPGKHIAVVTNLKPATLMGIRSEGMLLATDGEDGALSLVGFDRPPKIGAKIR